MNPSDPIPVPMLDLHRQFASIRDEVLPAVERVCISQQYVLGPEVIEFERETTEFLGCADTVACASGTDALWLALLAAGVGPGDRVITTSFSFFATASSIVRVGAIPVFADVDPLTLNLCPRETYKVLAAVGERRRAKAVLAVHLYGQCADMDGLGALNPEFGVEVLEDAAQAFGAEWNSDSKSKKAGALTRAAAFSFYPTKNLSAAGDAGCVTTMEPVWAERMRRLRNHGSPKRYLHDEIGWNSRLDSLQAAVLRVKLRHIAQWNQQRRERASLYNQLFQASGLTTGTDAPVRLPYENPSGYHIYHQYVIRVPRRDELREFLTARKIGSEIYYPLPLHLQPCFEYLGYKPGDLPETERAAAEVLAIPMFPELRDEEQQRVVGAISEFYS